MKNKFIPVLMLCFLLASLTSKSQDAKDYNDRIQSIREKSSDFWQKKGPTVKDLQKSIKMTEGAIRILDSIPVTGLANGNIYLKGKRHDLYMDMANSYAVANKKDSAFYWLNKMANQATYSSLVSMMMKDSTFSNLWSDPRFTAFAGKMKRTSDLYKGTAFETSYKEDISDAEKVEGLSLLWMQARANFVYFDRLQIDWNRTYMDYLPLVLKTKGIAAYYKLLIQFYAQLHDGHTNVYVPKELQQELYSRPPMRTNLIEGRVFVSEVFSDSLIKVGVVPGLEVLSIDSVPVISYADKNIKPYQSSSTSQDLEVREFTYSLLSGPLKQPIIFEFKNQRGKRFTKVVWRSGYHDIVYPNSVVYQTVGNVGYLQVNNFESSSINSTVDSLFRKEISRTKGLIIDIRYNGGGNDEVGFNIIKKLTNKSFKVSKSKWVKHYSMAGDDQEWEENDSAAVSPDGKIFYNKPVVLLIGPRTFSAAEDFAVAFDYMKRGKMIGMTTGGSTGQPINFKLPGGGFARVCGRRDSYPDGKEFVGIGIIPNIVVKSTVEHQKDGFDAIKSKAFSLLQ